MNALRFSGFLAVVSIGSAIYWRYLTKLAYELHHRDDVRTSVVEAVRQDVTTWGWIAAGTGVLAIGIAVASMGSKRPS